MVDGWTPFLTVWTLEGSISLPPEFEIVSEQNADGSVTRLGNALAGDLSTFSSHGPTSDGRVKPDICAPGQYLVSAINAYYLPYYLRSYIFDSTTFGGQSYYYALMQGTSMSSPATAGIVALWLQ